MINCRISQTNGSIIANRLEAGMGVGMLTTNLNRCLQLQEDRLLHEDLSGNLAERGDILLLDLDTLSATVNHLVDDSVYIQLMHFLFFFFSQ